MLARSAIRTLTLKSFVAFLLVVFDVRAAEAGSQDRVVHQVATLVRLHNGAVALLPPNPPGTAFRPPLIVLLHGAGEDPAQMIEHFTNDVDTDGAVLLAPKSTGATWDIVAKAERRSLDVTSLADPVLRYSKSLDGDRVMSAIAEVKDLIATDPAHMTLLGFSDGATFALGLGTARDRPFASVIALSPGLAAVAAHPAPKRRVLVMHAREDTSLPFDFTRDTIVPALRGTSLRVRFVPFNGGHTMPPRPLDVFRREFPE